jgi:hypothetical protein
MIFTNAEQIDAIITLMKNNQQQDVLCIVDGMINFSKYLLNKAGGEITFNRNDLQHYSEMPLDIIENLSTNIVTIKAITQ